MHIGAQRHASFHKRQIDTTALSAIKFIQNSIQTQPRGISDIIANSHDTFEGGVGHFGLEVNSCGVRSGRNGDGDSGRDRRNQSDLLYLCGLTLLWQLGIAY